MSNPIVTSHAHHVTLTVRDVNRSKQFYLDLFNFQFVTDFGPRAILSNGSLLLVLAPPPDPDRAVADDRFDENRVGLDHLSLNVATRADLDAAADLRRARRIARRDQAARAVRHCGAGLSRSR